ncbi:Uncharacterized protein TCAP_00661 [Tolypocladium capitatum]|uniref:GAR domain-containing protein n=1 Tax=Tolypocladium capitatum TaxID=45235 RepID=A0A2K3QPG5_9HYPO|nr:Uncharacterized protein TCAP_00661 [Tolypocladium capitatum]
MTDPPTLLKPGKRHSVISSHHSPTRHRAGDDILAHLAPPTALEALASSTGALRRCLDGASAAERDFAMRAALASKSIWEWVDELGDWNWPAGGGSAGFEGPTGRRRDLSIHVTAPEGESDEYVGSLLAEDLARYERRVEEISQDMDELAVEEIKSHVLTNHIMPLSRPSTPMTESSRFSSLSSYNKMEDLTAVITAIVVQTLPNLAKLSRLLQVWSIRLGVLQRVPSLLYAIEDAEVGLRSGWAAITQPPKRASLMAEDGQRPSLKRQDFEVMKRVLVGKVAKPGLVLDYMLDCLEGMQDTLPGRWLDRMEAVERDYGDWVAACERKMREEEWTTGPPGRTPARTPAPQEGLGSDLGLESRPSGLPVVVDADDAATSPVPLETENSNDDIRTAETAADLPSSPRETQLAGDQSPVARSEGSSDSGFPGLRTPSDRGSVDYERSNGGAPSSCQLELPSLIVDDDDEASIFETTNASALDDFSEDESTFHHIMTPVEEEDELELPPLRASASRNSLTSQTSTIIRGTSSHFGAPSSDPPEVSASPEVRRDRIREAKYVDDDSPPSSPPLPGEDSRAPSAVLLDSPVITSIPEDEASMFSKGPADQSFVDDFDDTLSMSEITSPMMRRESSSDQQLRQQISEIIESIPARIKLSAEPPSVNLNPPDLYLPRLKKKPSKEPFKRSASSLSAMSSRTATPSFTLSPAKNARPRHQRGQQEIKVYHLSRSTGEPPIKLFIRCVGERGERVMVRVGGGWADLSEYLKEYATHHGRRSAGAEKARVEVRDGARAANGLAPNIGSSPPRPASPAAESLPVTPLDVRKTRRSVEAANSEAPRLRPKTPAGSSRATDNPPSSEGSAHSRSSSRLSWVEDDSSFLGLAGPTGKKIEMSEENKAWVESVKEKVRLVSGERRASGTEDRSRLGELGKVGGTKRLFRKPEDRNWR